MSDPIVLWIPRPPDNANNRGHWRIAHEAMLRLRGELDDRLAVRLLPAPPARPLVSATLESHWYIEGRHRFLDQDNAVRRLKPVIDWLVAMRYLAGDTSAQLQLVPPVQMRQHLPTEAPPLTSVRLTLAQRDRTPTGVYVRLTPRELEIAHLVALGCSARQIGLELRLTQQSIERRIRQIADKIDGDLPPRKRITRWWWQSQQPPTTSEGST